MKKANFITFEGPEGAGKTTAIQAVLPFLEELTSKVVVTTREPGGNPLAEAVRDLLKEQQEPAIDARTEVLLLAASRREHVVQTILPALNNGVVVVSDRYLDSSLAYQGGGRGLGMQAVQAINDYAIENPETGQAVEPGLTIYMDLPVEIGLERVFKHRTGKIDRMDRENLDFHRRVRESYLELAAQNPEQIKTVNANQPADKVLEDVKTILLENWR